MSPDTLLTLGLPAEVLTLLTGDEYFPGGVGEFKAPMNEFLVFEEGA